MSQQFDHFIITRFSVVFAKNQAPPDSHWLETRLELFGKTAIASISAQSEPGFKWLVFFDDRVDPDFRSRVDTLAAGRFEPIWTSEFFDGKVVAGVIADRTNKPYVITTRVDNDDSLATDFVATVQRLFARQERVYINFVRGFQQVFDGRVYRYDAISNAFISMIERADRQGGFRTVFDGKHFEAPRLGDIIQVATAPMWCQTIHAGNMMNQVRGPMSTARALRKRVHNDIPSLPDRPYRTFLLDWTRSLFLSLPQLWMRQPRFFKEWVRARRDLCRGTHVHYLNRRG